MNAKYLAKNLIEHHFIIADLRDFPYSIDRNSQRRKKKKVLCETINKIHGTHIRRTEKPGGIWKRDQWENKLTNRKQ